MEEVLLFLFSFGSQIFDVFLAHPSRRLEWAIVIAHRLFIDVYSPSVRRRRR